MKKRVESLWNVTPVREPLSPVFKHSRYSYLPWWLSGYLLWHKGGSEFIRAAVGVGRAASWEHHRGRCFPTGLSSPLPPHLQRVLSVVE